MSASARAFLEMQEGEYYSNQLNQHTDMAIFATNEGGSYALPPAGTFVARCYSMIHIGTVNENYLGENKELNKVRISFELPTELHQFKEGEPLKPFTVSKEYTLSMNEKANLRKMLESWRGKPFTEDQAKRFDITGVLGAPCMITIIHKTSQAGKTRGEIVSISNVPKGMEVGPQVNPTFEFSYEDYDQTKFNSLPDFLKNKMVNSREYQRLTGAFTSDTIHVGTSNEEDDLPF